jgi:hypothetical protein
MAAVDDFEQRAVQYFPLRRRTESVQWKVKQ